MMEVAASAGWALLWWATFSALGLAAHALLASRLPLRPPLRWALLRWAGPLACAFALWLAAHRLPAFTPGWTRAVAAAFVAAGLFFAWRRRALRDADVLARGLRLELAFVLPFAAYLLMRGFNHDIIGLEKFMDFGFVNAALHSATMPPHDPWYAGGTINYYYFGHYFAAFLIQLAGVPPAVGFNLMLATLFAAAFQLAHGLVHDLAAALGLRLARYAAVLSGTWITLGGNYHSFIYGLVWPALHRAGLASAPPKEFWLSDSTRFVGHTPPTADKLIHEFPAYAFYVGDLHAHVLDLPNVLAALALLLAWLRFHRREARGAQAATGAALGACVGIMAMTNAWDGLIYGTLVAITVACVAARPLNGASLRALAITALAGLVALQVAFLPFLAHFRAFASGWGLVHSHTPAWQWLVLYGAQLALAVTGAWIARRLVASKPRGDDEATAAFLAMCCIGGLACALVPEVVYVKDIYNPDWYRANTAFKFGLQAFVLLVIGACVAVALLFDAPRLNRRPWLAVTMLELGVVPCVYYAWFFVSGALAVAPQREWRLNGQRYLERQSPEDLAVMRWLLHNAAPGDVVVEAVGESYTYAARMSANTGLATLLGWRNHEWLWRGPSRERDARADRVRELYRNPAGPVARGVVQEFAPSWIVVGAFERERYGPMDEAALATLGDVAYRAGATSVVRVAPLPAARP